MGGYLQEQIDHQITQGVEGSLVMRLRRAEVDGEKLTDEEITCRARVPVRDRMR